MRLSFFRTGLTEKKSGELVLCAVSHNDILNSAMMSEVAETLQLFAALWNYNLNLSAERSGNSGSFRRKTGNWLNEFAAPWELTNLNIIG